jgi:hypothetical protein
LGVWVHAVWMGRGACLRWCNVKETKTGRKHILIMEEDIMKLRDPCETQ